MQFFNGYDTPRSPNDQVFRTSRFNAVVMMVIMSSLIVGLFVFARMGGYYSTKVHFPSGICYWISGVLAFFALFFFPPAIGTFSDDNWVMVYNLDRLTFKFRTYLNRHFDKNDIQSLSLQPSEIEFVRKTQEWRVTSMGTENSGQWYTYLEIKLREGTPEILKNYIQEEIKRPSPGYGFHKIKYMDYPVTISSEGSIYVCWNGVRPPIEQALKLLSTMVPVFAPYKIEKDFTKIVADLKGIITEEQIKPIRELAQRGDILGAIKVAREVLKMDLTKAKEYVDGFVKDPPRKDGPGPSLG